MGKLQSWAETLKGKGIQVIDNTDDAPVPANHPPYEPTYQAADLPPLPTREEIDAAMERSKLAREATYAIEPSKPVLITPPAKGQVPFKVEPSDPALVTPTKTVIPVPEATLPNPNHLSFAALAEQAQEPEQLVVTTIEKVFDSSEGGQLEPTSGISWTDLVASAERQEGLPPQVSSNGETDFTPDSTVYLSVDVPEGVELVVKINGQELL